MATLLASPRNFASHATPQGHPERPDRMRAIEEALRPDLFPHLLRRDAIACDLSMVDLVHAPGYLQALAQSRPAEGMAQIDEDTFISSGSLAEHERPLGFCLINTVAIGARATQRKFGAERVAIVDFDVHHGNGTQDIFKADPSVFYGSSHQMPLFPGTGAANETGVGNIFNAPLAARTGRDEMRAAYDGIILPALEAFRPDFLLISAGFDADYRDPLAQLNWRPDDFAWVTGRLMEIAGRCCGGRIVSMLEGGYDRQGLATGVAAHVTTLMGQTSG